MVVNRPNLASSASQSVAPKSWVRGVELGGEAMPAGAADSSGARKLAIQANGTGSAAPGSEQPGA